MLPFNSAKPSCILSLLFIFSREVPEVSRLYSIFQRNRVEPVADVCVLHVGASGVSVMTQRHPKSFLCAQLAGACLLLVTGDTQRVSIYSLWGACMRGPTEVWVGPSVETLSMFKGSTAYC